ncbi:MAG TPA: hypothetical protein VG387_18985 [Rhizomicrobium sp.]|jgi:hypothetical protein|nr:hypothetical protein [Rhizomicrobium sp.]
MRRVAVLLFAALSLGACVMVKEPIGTTVGYRNDPALEGRWTGNDDKSGSGDLQVTTNSDRAMSVTVTDTNAGTGEQDHLAMTLTTVKLGHNRYMNISDVRGDKPDDSYPSSLPLLYRSDGRTLSLYALDEKAVQAAIKSGKIEGDVTITDYYTTVSITAKGPALDAYMAKDDAAKLFKPFVVLHRP